MGLGKWMENREVRDLDKQAAKDRLLDNAEPHVYIGYVQSRNTEALLGELRFIRWILLLILLVLFSLASHFLPSGWWYKGFWS